MCSVIKSFSRNKESTVILFRNKEKGEITLQKRGARVMNLATYDASDDKEHN